MMLFGLLFALAIGALIYGVIGGLILKVAYRLTLRHPMEFGDAFKVMAVSFLLSVGANLMLGLLGLGDGLIPVLISLAIYFAIVTYLLMTMEGLTVGQALAVAGIMTVLAVILLLLFMFLLMVAAIGPEVIG